MKIISMAELRNDNRLTTPLGMLRREVEALESGDNDANKALVLFVTKENPMKARMLQQLSGEA